MDEPAKRALHGLYSEKTVLADGSEYSAKLGAREDQPFADTGENLTAWRLAAIRRGGAP